MIPMNSNGSFFMETLGLMVCCDPTQTQGASTADGASLVTTYRGTFNDQVQRGGIDGLIKALQERNRAPEPPKPPTKK